MKKNAGKEEMNHLPISQAKGHSPTALPGGFVAPPKGLGNWNQNLQVMLHCLRSNPISTNFSPEPHLSKVMASARSHHPWRKPRSDYWGCRKFS